MLENSTLTISPNIIPLDDTFILYDSNSLLSFCCAYFSLIPIGILMFYLSWFITTREIEACIIAGGQVSNEIFNNVVKKIIKQPRPAFFGDSFQNNTMRSGYGMPSAHSQFMGFFFIYFTLTYIRRWNNLTSVKKVLGVANLACLSAIVCFSRAYLNYHTIGQVIVGWSLGACAGSTYYFIIGVLRELGFINWLLDLWILKQVYAKDSFNLAPFSLRDEYNHYLRRKITTDSRTKKNN
ncbi:hypothetical protein TPHA_0K01220 [Tetrapisispora phaffii CBS 4417]|uniref:Phosphatidic acid phosphatase type 2/haloperoxidase domain-containing protein n=1 Tax=Tetrapisispora phaffii (strain ATCC 24235 / CBS 4417 / NBRC 1672 / NRRL Y-8282 / UCD 70-5) TaxID=1071381 RepID=G8BZC8_TETPH|nr:hypothetical protein TPHA_0K01220 [Tetrapisispora phaffii CBS 4417]CCE65256.1 hypothetical protein TPHA_0K01220 [Tetrapisispora phaffii CBS 4417]